MQLSLFVQLEPNLGGISGAACYITVGSKLSTTRLTQIQNNHPSLSSALCSLDDIHTLSAPTIEILMHVLTANLPNLQESLALQKDRKPIRLVVIDSISSLFQASLTENPPDLFAYFEKRQLQILLPSLSGDKQSCFEDNVDVANVTI